ncbi:MAG: mechanosensitive ion channel family protein [Oscillospiraceae bacterium]|nr:mechanosensitive ion channel family protein [Oscillospiraceae bacterium]
MPDWLKSLENTVWSKVILSAVIVVAAVVLWRIVHYAVKRVHAKHGRDGLQGTAGTAVSVIYSVLRGLLIVVVILVVLHINGVNVTSMVAGLGIIGAIVGLAFQDLLKDIIMGIRLVSDDFFKVGDVIEYEGGEGQVVSFNLRSTKIRMLDDASIVTISNRNISDIKKRSHLILLNIPLPYEEDYRKIHEVLGTVATEIARLDGVERCEYKGTQRFDDSAIIYRINLFCPPERKWPMWRAAHKILQERLDEAGLRIPYQQIDIHNIPAK